MPSYLHQPSLLVAGCCGRWNRKNLLVRAGCLFSSLWTPRFALSFLAGQGPQLNCLLGWTECRCQATVGIVRRRWLWGSAGDRRASFRRIFVGYKTSRIQARQSWLEMNIQKATLLMAWVRMPSRLRARSLYYPRAIYPPLPPELPASCQPCRLRLSSAPLQPPHHRACHRYLPRRRSRKPSHLSLPR